MAITKIKQNTVVKLIKQAKSSPKKKALHLLHHLDKKTNTSPEKIQKLILAVEPDGYLIPHRHPFSETETTIALQGKIAVVCFNGNGSIKDYCIISHGGEYIGTKIDTHEWHNAVSLEGGSVVCEFIEGPYDSRTHKDTAKWAPREDDIKGISKFLAKIKQQLK